MNEYITLGLDFGTHQSKICVEDATEARNRNYTFFEFNKKGKGKCLFLPSVVQVNDDNTLSYGFCDESRAKVLGEEYILEKPEPIVIKEPVLRPIPHAPQDRVPRPFAEFEAEGLRRINYNRKRNCKGPKTLEQLSEKEKKHIFEEFSAYTDKIQLQNIDARHTWERKVHEYSKANQEALKNYESEKKKAEREYKQALAKWEKSKRVKTAIYRYFKIALFSKEYKWDADIRQKEISIWYITYLLFLINEKYPGIRRVQMGIPQSIGDSELSAWQIEMANTVFYCAWDLMTKVGTLDRYLQMTLDELKSVTKTFGVSKEDYEDAPYLLVLPEAFASLESIASQGKLKKGGLHLLLDIGGGSTDVSIFYINGKSKPNISAIVSIHKGLNFIFRMYRKDNINLSMDQIRKRFMKDQEPFEPYIAKFLKEIQRQVQEQIVGDLMMTALRAGITSDAVKSALYNKPVIYTGGGGLFSSFHIGISYFQDPLSISEDLLSVKDIRNKGLSSEEMSILTVAYGLSMPQRRCPEMVPIKQLFREYQPEKPKNDYIHGLTDVD